MNKLQIFGLLVLLGVALAAYDSHDQSNTLHLQRENDDQAVLIQSMRSENEALRAEIRRLMGRDETVLAGVLADVEAKTGSTESDRTQGFRRRRRRRRHATYKPYKPRKGCTWRILKNKFSNGYPGGPRTVYTLEDAKARCVQIGQENCAAITCNSKTRSKKRCTVRSNFLLRDSKRKEWSYTPDRTCFKTRCAGPLVKGKKKSRSWRVKKFGPLIDKNCVAPKSRIRKMQKNFEFVGTTEHPAWVNKDFPGVKVGCPCNHANGKPLDSETGLRHILGQIAAMGITQYDSMLGPQMCSRWKPNEDWRKFMFSKYYMQSSLAGIFMFNCWQKRCAATKAGENLLAVTSGLEFGGGSYC